MLDGQPEKSNCKSTKCARLDFMWNNLVSAVDYYLSKLPNLFCWSFSNKKKKFYIHVKPSEHWKQHRHTAALNHRRFKWILSSQTITEKKADKVDCLEDSICWSNSPRMSPCFCPYSASTFHTMETEKDPVNSFRFSWENTVMWLTTFNSNIQRQRLLPGLKTLRALLKHFEGWKGHHYCLSLAL